MNIAKFGSPGPVQVDLNNEKSGPSCPIQVELNSEKPGPSFRPSSGGHMDHMKILKSRSSRPCLGGPEQREIQPFRPSSGGPRDLVNIAKSGSGPA